VKKKLDYIKYFNAFHALSGKVSTIALIVLNFCFVILYLQYWGLNSGLSACEAILLPLEP
jgi:hypothetical protein